MATLTTYPKKTVYCIILYYSEFCWTFSYNGFRIFSQKGPVRNLIRIQRQGKSAEHENVWNSRVFVEKHS